MLLRFEVSNFRSVMDPVELSMVAVDQDRPAARQVGQLAEQVLTAAAVYGPNASGKSSVLAALAWLSDAVGRSLRDWDTVIPREPFRFGDGPSSPTTFDVEMIVGGVRYSYCAEIGDSRVLFEALCSYPERRRRTLFERDGDGLSFRRGLASLLSGTRELLTPATLALSAAMRFADPEIRAFGQHLAGLQAAGLRSRLPAFAATERLLTPPAGPERPDELRDTALALLRLADPGIDDVHVTAGDAGTGRRLALLHRAGGEHVRLELAEESAGTQAWFALIGPALTALQRGQVLLVDDLGASLHPLLSARFLQLFQDPVTNPDGAQLLFTTHDASLLGHLNRDEVWLADKDDRGRTTLTALAEYGGERVRRSVNLERAYLAGRFGAVPEFDQYGLQKAPGAG